MNAISPTGSNAMMPTNMDTAIQLAEMMSRGKLVPAHLQGSPGDCLMVIEASMRWGMSPFAVAQCTSVIQGKLMFEGKLVAAALNASGIMLSRLEYEFSGANGERSVTVRGTLRGEDKPRDIVLTLKEAKTTNSMWTKQPDQQLVYAGTRVWARRHAPEVMLGVYTPEEFDEQSRETPFVGTTLEHRAVDSKQAPQIAATIPPPKNGKRHSVAPPKGAPDSDWRACLDWVGPAMTKLRNREAVIEVANGPTCSDIIANGPEWARAELSAMLAENYGRFPSEDDGSAANEPDLPEVEIPGEKYLAAG